MAATGGKKLLSGTEKHAKQEQYLKQYEEWKKSRELKQVLTEQNQPKKSATEILKVKSGGVVKRQSTFSSARRSPRLKENISKVTAIKRSHSLTVKPTNKAVLNVKSKVFSGSPKSVRNEPTVAKTTKPLHRVSSVSGVARKQQLEEWKKKKEEERQQALQARLQSVRTPHKGPSNQNPRTPAHKDGRPAFVVENLVHSKTKFESIKAAGLLDDRRSTLGDERRLTLGSGFDRRKSYAESLRLSGKKPTVQGLKRSQSVLNKPTGPCKSLIQRKKEENKKLTTSSSNIRRSNSCVGQSSSAAAMLQRRKSYGQGLRAAVELKSAKPAEKGKRTSLSSLHRQNKVQNPQQTAKPEVVKEVLDTPGPPTSEECHVTDAIPVTTREQSATPVTIINTESKERRRTFSPKETNTPVQQLKADTGPGRRRSTPRSTPQQATPQSKVIRKSRKSILKSEQLPKTPGLDRRVQFSTPSSVTLRRGQGQGTPSWTPKKEQSMREKLESWLISKGRTPTRFRHLRCFDEHLNCKSDPNLGKKVDAGLTSDELTYQQALLEGEDAAPPVLNVQLEEVLAECTELVEMGCPGDTMLGYLDKIEEHMPSSKQSSAYWICRARVAEEEDQEEVAVDMYESAVVHGAQPPRDIVDSLKGFVTRMEERKRAKKEASVTPWKGHNEQGMDEGNIFESSSIKYCVSKSTPLMKRLDSTGRRRKSTPKAVITPVRRSTRLSHSNLPSILQDHDEIVDEIENLPKESQASALFKPNRALEQEFEEAMDEQ